MNKFGLAEKVYIELEWFDGPRKGVASINGIPHRFVSLFDESSDEYCSSFIIFSISENDLALEIEQWRIFVEWNDRYESGTASIESHPSHRGINKRWDEINSILNKSRKTIPDSARRAKADFVRLDKEQRYDEGGPDYALCWQIL